MLGAILPYVPAAISFGQSLLNRGSKPPLGEDTAYGRFLAERAKSGMYSPEVRSRIMSGVGRDLGALAQRARADISGGLASTSGMRNSIAGQRLLSQPARDMSGSMSDISSRLDIANEQSKQEAASAYSQLKDESRNARRGWNSQMNQTLWGGALNTLGSALSTYQQQQQLGALDEGMTQWQSLVEQGNNDEANALANMLIMRYGGM